MSSAILYHVAPASRRSQIELEGLRADAAASYPQLVRFGIYCWPERDPAWLWTGEQKGLCDIWSFDAVGLDPQPDPACTGALYLVGPVSPEQLTLLYPDVRRHR